MTDQFFDERPIPFPTLSAALNHWARATPDALALCAGDTELTYSQLASRVSG